MPSLRLGSLFSGIGGLELGLERTGMRTVFQVESDPYALAVLAKHWPDVPRFKDVRDVGSHNLPACDVLCGGFPCQDISVAGRGAGIDGQRSGLWREFARLVRELRPRYVVVENVPALLARGFGRVLGDLAARGYDAEWTCLRAADVGAPHRRERLFLLAYPQRHRRTDKSQSGAVGEEAGKGLGEARGRLETLAGDSGQDVADAMRQPIRVKSGRSGRESGSGEAFPGLASVLGTIGNTWSIEPDVGRMAHGIPARVDRLRCLGNAVVPQVAEVIGRLIQQRES